MKMIFLSFFLTIVAFSKANDCDCRLKTENRIVNGQFAIEHSIPWFVSLARTNGEHFCGGAIMNEKYILTASHCTKKQPDEILVRVGAHNIKEKIPRNQVYEVKKIHFQEFKATHEPGDISILELKNKITFIDGVVEKGCFNLEEREYSDQFLAAGWGMTERSYVDPKTKEWVLNGWADKRKQVFYEQTSPCDDFLICLKPKTEGDSVCQGDSGGPLHYTENGITKIEGVASFISGTDIIDGKEYHCKGKAFYSRLSFYSDWISEIADFNFCGTGEVKPPKYKKKFLGLF